MDESGRLKLVNAAGSNLRRSVASERIPRKPWQWPVMLRNDLSRIAAKVAGVRDPPPPALTPVEIMTLVLEDRRFFTHSGIDLISIARELARALTLRRHGGASTIDMQFVRTVTGYRRRTLARKIYEMLLAMALRGRFDKRTILWTYLAIAYFGTGLTGADAAAQKMFQKPACALNFEQAAFISAMLCAPRPRAAPPEWKDRVEKRAAYGIRILNADPIERHLPAHLRQRPKTAGRDHE